MRNLLTAAVSSAALALAACVQVPVPSDRGGPTPQAPGAGGKDQNGYAFVSTRPNGQPVRWSTCGPIRYVVRPAKEPDGGRELLEEALRRVSEASGLQFSFAGATDEAPVDDRPPFHDDRYGDRWSPVLVAWSDPGEYGRLEGRPAGFGGPVRVHQRGAVPRYVSGIVVLDAEQLAGMPEEARRAVVVHELAHVVGLDHVDDRGQLMNAVQYGTEVTSLQEGDLRGLRALGNGTCLEPIAPGPLGG
jgi:hypothetical protein